MLCMYSIDDNEFTDVEMKKFTLWLGLTLALIFNMQANAALLTGGYSYSGLFGYDLTFDSSGSLTAIDFTDNNPSTTYDGAFQVNGTTGSFDVFAPDYSNPFSPVYTIGFISDITVAPFVTIDPLLSIDDGKGNTSAFTLTSINVDYSNSTTGVYALSGLGVFNLTTVADGQFTPRQASWTLEIDGANGLSTFQGKAVPEPATLALLGIGLLGLTFARRNRKA